ncbi:MAG TPA: polysaccharide biosynthesis C-terminal domain-containing protein [Gemmatimonadaceae bacterium]|nr:polysaccharide biosynthesis C-terminal domain-containing protein [Gemmatimonadaceae bacterium]
MRVPLSKRVMDSFVVRQGSIMLGGQISLALFKLAALWLIARLLGPDVQGAFSLASAGTAAGAILFCVGLEYANAYIVGRNREVLSAVASNSLMVFAVSLVAAPLWATAFVQLFPHVATPLGAQHLWIAITAIGLATSLLSLAQGLQASAIGLHDFRSVAVANLASGLVWALGALVGTRIGYGAILWAVCVSHLVLVLAYLRRQAPSIRDFRIARDVLRSQLHYGARTLPGSIARSLNMRAPLYIVAVYLTTTEVGVFGLVLSLAETMLYLPSALSQVALGLAATKSRQSSELRYVYLAILVVGITLSAAVAFLGSTVLRWIFGPAYASGSGALAILILAVTAHSVGLLRIHTLYGRGEPAAASIAQIIALCLTLAGSILLIPRYRLLGAALSMLLTYVGFVLYLIALPRSRKSSDVAASELTVVAS